MKYSKPEVVVVAAALAVIQSGKMKDSFYLDSNTTGDKNATANAYEADE
jgi:hypothetical protein